MQFFIIMPLSCGVKQDSFVRIALMGTIIKGMAHSLNSYVEVSTPQCVFGDGTLERQLRSAEVKKNEALMGGLLA